MDQLNFFKQNNKLSKRKENISDNVQKYFDYWDNLS